MKKLLIIGARAFGREVYNLALHSKGYGEEFVVKGFLDDNCEALKGFQNYPTILSSVEDYHVEHDDVFTCALGDVHYKKKYVDIIKAKGGKFINLIHKSIEIDNNTTIGEGCIFMKGVVVSCDAVIGNFVTLNFNSTVTHNCRIGDFCQFNPYSCICGYVEVGSFVTINAGAMVIPKVKIEDESTIGAGSLVIGKVKTGTTVFGNPARKLKM